MCEKVSEGENPQSKRREVYKEKEGAGGEGPIFLSVLLNAHFGADEAPGGSFPFFVLFASEVSSASGGDEDPFWSGTLSAMME